MAFKFYEDDGSWTEITSAIPFVHWDDQREGSLEYSMRLANIEDDPLDDGSITGQAASDPGVDSILITPVLKLAQRANSTAYTVGQEVYSGLYRYRCTTAGTTAASSPAMPTTPGATISDGTAVWTCIEKMHQTSELKLATTAVGLDSAVAGAALNLGLSLTSGASNYVTVHFRIDNAILALDAAGVDLRLQLTSLVLG